MRECEKRQNDSMETAIFTAGLLYFAGHVLTRIFERSKIPDVLLLIIIGIVLGPITGLSTVEEIGATGRIFTQFALIIILFEGGLGLELGTLIHSARQSSILTVVFFFLSVTVVAVIMHYGFEYSTLSSVLTGFICGGTSSAVVIPLLSKIRATPTANAMLVLESALTDVLCIVFSIGVLQSIESGAFSVGKVAGALITSLVMATVVGVICGGLWLRLLPFVRKFPNTQFATCFYMFMVYGVTEMLDFSGAIAVLAFGIVIGNAPNLSRHVRDLLGENTVGIVTDIEKEVYKELAFLVKIFFFIYLGISIPFEDLDVIIVSGLVVVALFMIRPLAARFFAGRKTTAHDRTIIAVMLPKGLAAAVLAGLPIQYEMAEGQDIQAITYYVVLLSILTTSVLIPIVERTKVGKFYDRMFGCGTEATTENNKEQNEE